MSCASLAKDLNVITEKGCMEQSTAANENGKRFSFDNHAGKRICRLKVDGCWDVDQRSKKCDYLFKIEEPEKYYLVELKGSNVTTACKQIVDTFEKTNRLLRKEARLYKGVIVSSRVPKAEPAFLKIKEEIFRKFRLQVVKTHIRHVERL